MSHLICTLPYLCTHLSESIHSWTKGTQTHPTLPYPTLPYPTLSYPTLPFPTPSLPYSRTFSKSSISVVEFSRSLYLCTHLSESIHSWTKGTQTHPTLPYPPTPTHILLPTDTIPLKQCLNSSQVPNFAIRSENRGTIIEFRQKISLKQTLV